MREIKFRAWDKARKCWLSCFLISSNGNIYPDKRTMSPIPQDEVCIMQYTNLKDSKGKEIYEGDILCYASGHKEIVRHKIESHVQTYSQGDYGKMEVSGFVIYGYYGNLKDSLVIGNIFENPELLN